MNITDNIIITDTNIITDLDHAGILEYFVQLDNVYVSDLVKYNEFFESTGNLELLSKIKVIEATEADLVEVHFIKNMELRLSVFDVINYVVAKNNHGILATGDARLKKYAEQNGVEVIRIIKIIELLSKYGVISKEVELNAYRKLLNHERTRVPKDELMMRIEKLEYETV